MKRSASAIWVGSLKGGKGAVSTESNTLSQSEYFASDDAKKKGTNPYELIAASHAACFSMTLANELASAGFYSHHIVTIVTVTMEQLPAGRTITGIELNVLADVPRAKQSDFISATINAKTNCTISRLLSTNISMSAKLQTSENRSRQKLRRAAHSLKASITKKQSIEQLTYKG